jgi:chromate transport protein ChrA
MEQVLGELIDFLKNASPVVWNALIKQTYMEGVVSIVWAAILVLIAFGFYKLGKKLNNSDEDTLFWLSSFVASGIFLFIGVFRFIEGIMWLINPEFYAIRYILEKITGG